MENSFRHKQFIVKKICDSPHEFDFTPALYILRALAKEKKLKLNLQGNPRSKFTFSTIEKVKLEKDKIDVIVNLSTLFGAAGVLPNHYTDAIQISLRNKNFAPFAFLNIFNQRVLSIFFDANIKNNFALSYKVAPEQNSDPISEIIKSLTGVNIQIKKYKYINPQILLYYSGFFSQPPNAYNLKIMLEEYFVLQFSICEFEKEIIYLEKNDCTRLSNKSLTKFNRLGVDAILGSKVDAISNKFLITIGPVKYSDYENLLPHGEMFKAIVEFVRIYIKHRSQFSIKVLLEKDTVPALFLGAKNSLGLNTWLKETKRITANDYYKILLKS